MIANAKTAQTISLPAQSLRLALLSVIPCACRESSRFALGGVYFEIGGGALYLVASDGNRLAAHTIDSATIGGFESGDWFILPIKAAKEIADRITKTITGVVDLQKTGSTIRASFSNASKKQVEISADALEGRFPKWRDFLPSGDGLTILRGKFPPADLEISRGCQFEKGSGKHAGVKLTVDPLRLSVTVEKHDSKNSLPLVDVDYLADCFANWHDSAAIHLFGNEKPMRIECGRTVFVIMPLRRDGR